MHRTATCFGLIVVVAVFAAGKAASQEPPSAAGTHLQPNAGGEAAVVKRVVDDIMQPYLAEGKADCICELEAAMRPRQR